MPLKPEKRENRLFSQNHLAFTLSNLAKYVMILRKRLHSERYIFWHLRRQQAHLTKKTMPYDFGMFVQCLYQLRAS